MSIQDDSLENEKFNNFNEINNNQRQPTSSSLSSSPQQQITLNVNYNLTYNIENNKINDNSSDNKNIENSDQLEPFYEEIINLHYEHFRTETLTNFIRQLNSRSLSCSSGGATYFDSSDEEGVPIPKEIRENFHAKIIKDPDHLDDNFDQELKTDKSDSGRESRLKQLFKNHSLKKSAVSASSTTNDLHSVFKKFSCLKRIHSVVDINHNPTDQDKEDQNKKSEHFWFKKKQSATTKPKFTYLNGKTGQKLTKSDIVHCQQFSVDQKEQKNENEYESIQEELIHSKKLQQQEALNVPELNVEEYSSSGQIQYCETTKKANVNEETYDSYDTETEDYSSIVVGHRDPFDSEADPSGRPFRYHRRSQCNCHRQPQTINPSLSSISSSERSQDTIGKDRISLLPPPPIPHNTPDSIVRHLPEDSHFDLILKSSSLSLENSQQQKQHPIPHQQQQFDTEFTSQSSINQFDSDLFLEPNFRSISDCNFHQLDDKNRDRNTPNIIHILAPPSSLFLSSSSNPSLLNYATTTTLTTGTTDTTATSGAGRSTTLSSPRSGSEDRLLLSLNHPEQFLKKMIHHNNNNNSSGHRGHHQTDAAKYFIDPNSPQPPNQPSYVNISRVNHGYVPYNRYTSEYRRDDSLLRYPDRYQMQPESSSKGFLHRKVESLYGESFAEDWNENRHKVKKGQSFDKSPGAASGSDSNSNTTDQIKSTLAGSKLFQKIKSIDNSDLDTNKSSSLSNSSNDNKDWWLREHQAQLDQPHHNGGGSNASGDNSPQGFLNKLQEQRAKMAQKIQHGEKWLSNPKDIPEEYLGKIRAAIGKANLLLDKKFQQFQKLCEDSINQGDKEAFKIQNDDLQGFWDMMMIQVNDVNQTFEQLIKLKQNQWKMTPGMMMMAMDYHQHPQQQTSPRIKPSGHNSKSSAIQHSNNRTRRDSPQRKFDNDNNHSSSTANSPRDEERQRRLMEIKRRGKMLITQQDGNNHDNSNNNHQMITIFAPAEPKPSLQ